MLRKLTMVMGFTGYLLPFDQRSNWARAIGVPNATGPYLANLLHGGPEFGLGGAATAKPTTELVGIVGSPARNTSSRCSTTERKDPT